MRKKKLKKVNRRFLEPERASYRDDRIWEFRNHLELVKEQGLGRKDSTQQEDGDLSTDRQKEPETPPGRARFEDSASEEGTTGRTRARTSCPVQEPTGVSLDSGYSTDLSVPAPVAAGRITGPVNSTARGVQDCT